MSTINCEVCGGIYEYKKHMSKFVHLKEPFVCSKECVFKWIKRNRDVQWHTPATKGAVRIGWTDNKDYKSGYERNVAAFLIQNGIVFEYERWGFRLNSGTYTPDFYLPRYGCFLEVKGTWTAGKRTKMNRFREKYPYIPLLVVHWLIWREFKL